MKLGIVIILIGIAWCVRCYLLRPKVEVPVSTRLQHVIVKDNVFIKHGEFPQDHKLIIDYEYHEPQEGETIEWTYWSTPEGPNVVSPWGVFRRVQAQPCAAGIYLRKRRLG